MLIQWQYNATHCVASVVLWAGLNKQLITPTIVNIHNATSCCECDVASYITLITIQKSHLGIFFTDSPPSPSRPSAFEIKSTSITIDWSQSTCDGGHITKAFNIRYRSPNSPFSTYSYITVVDSSQRRHKITGLSPSTLYEFSVQTITFDTRISSYSLKGSFSTLPPGIYFFTSPIS